MQVVLQVVHGNASKGQVRLELPAIVGRSRGSQLTIAHPMISRQHCELVESNGMVAVRDLGSLNGTVVDGQRVQEAPLKPGDAFTVGPLTFQVDYEPAADAATDQQPSAWADAAPPPEKPPEGEPDGPQGEPEAREAEAAAAGSAEGMTPDDPNAAEVPIEPVPPGFLSSAMERFADAPEAKAEPPAAPHLSPSSAWADSPVSDSRWHFPIEGGLMAGQPGLAAPRPPSGATPEAPTVPSDIASPPDSAAPAPEDQQAAAPELADQDAAVPSEPQEATAEPDRPTPDAPEPPAGFRGVESGEDPAPPVADDDKDLDEFLGGFR